MNDPVVFLKEGKLVNLYFRNADGNEEIVDVGLDSDSAIMDAVHKDLSVRKPSYTIHYSRGWISPDNRYWIDFGSHTEFYVGDIVESDCEACRI